jgi:hypothetical protein
MAVRMEQATPQFAHVTMVCNKFTQYDIDSANIIAMQEIGQKARTQLLLVKTTQRPQLIIGADDTAI